MHPEIIRSFPSAEFYAEYQELKSSHKLAVIYQYRAQADLLKQRFRSDFTGGFEKQVDVTTMDGYQGLKKMLPYFLVFVQMIKKDRNIGFVGHFRRIIVEITRAKSSILVVQSVLTLRKDRHWSNLVESAKENRLFEVTDYDKFFSDENLKSLAVKKESSLSMEEVCDDNVDNPVPFTNFRTVTKLRI
ncbi:hypothetical protein FF2_016073 [Malus domestica]